MESAVCFSDILHGATDKFIRLWWNDEIIYDENSDGVSFDDWLDVRVEYSFKKVYKWECQVVDVHHVSLAVWGEE